MYSSLMFDHVQKQLDGFYIQAFVTIQGDQLIDYATLYCEGATEGNQSELDEDIRRTSLTDVKNR